MKTFTITLDGAGIDELLTALDDYEEWIRERCKVLVDRLAEIGVVVAQMDFKNAWYDGDNDVEVEIEDLGETSKAVVAVGNAALFIEFGTGVKYPDSHPEASKNGMIRGSYGHKLGRLKNGWRYPAENGAGTNGTIDPKHPGMIHTYGNPANMCMYNAAKHVREMLPLIVREVFT